jgi:protein-L-isoaspartate(D-aspartate) O-methyltransferase
MTALLASLANNVNSIEIFPDLKDIATSCLASFNFKNVNLKLGDALLERDNFPHQMFDVIVFTGSVAALSDSFLKQLTIGGRLFAYIGEWPVMSAFLITRQKESAWTKTSVFETYIPPLISGNLNTRFEF